ncbi:MAG: hypothetical protein IJV48_04945 [Ruminococcus sp.]|nr:hypothetical protein [Ruminococcus sp.]
MNENITPEINEEEVADTVTSAEETVEEAVDEAEETVINAEEETALFDEATAEAEENAAADEKPAKKKRMLQIPVIISLCIVAAALLGYFVFTAFFLKEPEGVTWLSEIEETPYYFEFNNDGTYEAYVGSVEINGTFQKSKSEEGDTLTLGSNIGNFYANVPATYTISGSRLLGNQTLDCSYGEDYDFTLTQAKREKVDLDLPEDFTPDENLVGSWVFKYFGYDIFRVTFNENGSMSLEQVQDGLTYNGIYTISDSTVNFTYYVTDNMVTPIDYSVDGDSLTFMGYNFVREGSELAEATPDQQLMIPEN